MACFSLIIHKKIDDVYEKLEDYNPTEKRRVFIVFDDMIADMESNEKLCHKATELFLRGREFDIFLAFSYQKRTSTNSIKSFV